MPRPACDNLPARYDREALFRAVFSGVLTLPAQLDSQVSFGPDTHLWLRLAAAKAYLGLAPEIRAFLAARRVRFMLGLYYDAVAIAGPQRMLYPDRRDNPRRHRNQSPGLYDRRAKMAYAFQYTLRKDIRDAIGLRPDAAALRAGLWHRQSPQNIACITRHEVWHALDDAAGLPSRWGLFRRAYQADIAALGGPRAARRAGLGYFVQDDLPHRGPSEVFAELGAALSGGGCGAVVPTHFPRSARCVAWLQEQMIACGRRGPDLLQAFLAFHGARG